MINYLINEMFSHGEGNYRSTQKFLMRKPQKCLIAPVFYFNKLCL